MQSEQARLLQEAITAFRAGRSADAERLVKKVTEDDPQSAQAAHLLGVIAASRGKMRLGLKMLRRAIGIDPASVESRNELTTLLRNLGQVDDSISHGLEAVRLRPNDAGTHNNLGLSHLAAGQFEKAISSFEVSVERAPKLTNYRRNLATAQSRLGARERAVASLEEAAAIETSSEGAIQISAELCELSAHTEAEGLLRQVVANNPEQLNAWQALGDILRERGKFDEAIATYRGIISGQPRHAGAFLGIVLSRRMNVFDRPLLGAVETLLQDPNSVGPSERALLHYALGKANDDLGRYEKAISHFDCAHQILGGQLELSGRRLDAKVHAANIDRMIATFEADRFEQIRGVDSELPVFVVGMIRSGTTLVDQILSSHPDVASAGEMSFWGSHSAALREIEAGRFGARDSVRLGEECCRYLRGIAPEAERIIDKMPINYLMLGLIHAIFPKARIIHCRRDPIDTCVSIYCTAFHPLPDFAYDRESIVAYYKQYLRLMAHWRRVIPSTCLLEIDYETLVGDRERVVRQLIEFCGLTWNDACLHHERNPRAVRTPSAWQVRQSVYSSSIGRWRHYERQLGAFLRLRSP